MKKSIATADFTSDINTVWETITDNGDYVWRSDLTRIDISEDGDSFTEIAKDGSQTNFNITRFEPCKFYAFDIEHKNFTGQWTGEFSESGEGTQVIFTELIKVRNPIMRILAKFFMNIKKIQDTYIKDLKAKLGEN